MKALRTAIWLLDEALDRIPAREDGRWRLCGGWGCRLRLSRAWDQGDGPYFGKNPA